jgi:thiol-disulfide isomerase/thioredoxin
VKSNRAKFAPHGIRNVLLQSDRETANAYQSKAVPSAVVVRDGIIDSPLAVGPDAIRSLVSVASLPPPVKKGGLVPSLRLPDLTGSTFDLSERGNRRTLLLFWNPSCGYCQQMLQDVKNWERDSASDGLELLVVSSGSLEAALAQGFQSRVLLDPGFGVGKVFGVSGTPSAVLVDEQGRVASEVSVGAQSVLALAGAIPAGSAGRS